MARYIDADLLKDEILSKAVRLNRPEDLCRETTIFLIDVAPTAKVQEVRHGKWQPFFRKTKRNQKGWKCSECKKFKHYKTAYCEKCGAKMDGSDKK